jgi:predicted ArsR family transcriptional regulator
MDDEPALDRRIAGVAALDQPVRRDLYRLLVSGGDWVTRDQAADALGLARSVAAFHLDKLADAGVVEVRFERTTGRRGPGAGRPSKLYRPARAEVAASVPERSYDLAGLILTEAVSDAVATGAPVETCLATTATAYGRRRGAAAAEGATAGRTGKARQEAVAAALADQGYEPRPDGRSLVLMNCPFHQLAEAHRTLVCGMNCDFLSGFLEGLDQADALDAHLDPRPGTCCVRIRPRPRLSRPHVKDS